MNLLCHHIPGGKKQSLMGLYMLIYGGNKKSLLALTNGSESLPVEISKEAYWELDEMEVGH